MLTKQKIVLSGLAVAALLAAGISAGTATAREDARLPHDPVAIGEDAAKQLVLLMDQDTNGKVSEAEFMKFMQAEFQRLDKDKSGELDVKELSQSGLHVEHFTAAGK